MLGSPRFYLDTDFTRLWRCNLHLLEREWFAHCPGNSSSASDNLEGEGGEAAGKLCLRLGAGKVVGRARKAVRGSTLTHVLPELDNCPGRSLGTCWGGGRAGTRRCPTACKAKRRSIGVEGNWIPPRVSSEGSGAGGQLAPRVHPQQSSCLVFPGIRLLESPPLLKASPCVAASRSR